MLHVVFPGGLGSKKIFGPGRVKKSLILRGRAGQPKNFTGPARLKKKKQLKYEK
jgi:hypothetical protein